MKNTLKKSALTKNKTQKNDKELVKKCMDTFVKNRVNKSMKSLRNFNKEMNKDNKNKRLNANKSFKISKNLLPQQTALNKSMYCNINCKDTILEPGPPDYVPKSLIKDETDDLILNLLKQRRKGLFKNKTNVLVDNFYEGISAKARNKLIKEGAISKCSEHNEIEFK